MFHFLMTITGVHTNPNSAVHVFGSWKTAITVVVDTTLNYSKCPLAERRQCHWHYCLLQLWRDWSSLAASILSRCLATLLLAASRAYGTADVSVCVHICRQTVFKSLLLQFLSDSCEVDTHDLHANMQKLEQLFETLILKFLANFLNAAAELSRPTGL